MNWLRIPISTVDASSDDVASVHYEAGNLESECSRQSGSMRCAQFVLLLDGHGSVEQYGAIMPSPHTSALTQPQTTVDKAS